MYCRNMISLVMMFVVLLGTGAVSFGSDGWTTVIDTDFNDGFEPGWGIINKGGRGNYWRIDNPYNQSYSPYAEEKFMMLNTYIDEHDMIYEDHLSTPPLDCTRYENIIINFSQYLYRYGTLITKVEVAAGDDVYLVDDFTESSYGSQTIDISDYAAGREDVKVVWSFYKECEESYGIWVVDDVKIEVAEYPALSISIPDHVIETEGVLSGVCTISRNRHLGSSLLVELESSDPDLISVPATVSIPSGEESADFAITIINNDDINPYRFVEISAGSDGFISSKSDTFIVDEDEDGDGLRDDWEVFYFGDLSQGPDGDYDGDGFDNADEHSTHYSPADATSHRIYPDSFGGCTPGGSNAAVIFIALFGYAVLMKRRGKA